MASLKDRISNCGKKKDEFEKTFADSYDSSEICSIDGEAIKKFNLFRDETIGELKAAVSSVLTKADNCNDNNTYSDIMNARRTAITNTNVLFDDETKEIKDISKKVYEDLRDRYRNLMSGFGSNIAMAKSRYASYIKEKTQNDSYTSSAIQPPSRTRELRYKKQCEDYLNAAERNITTIEELLNNGLKKSANAQGSVSPQEENSVDLNQEAMSRAMMEKLKELWPSLCINVGNISNDIMSWLRTNVGDKIKSGFSLLDLLNQDVDQVVNEVSEDIVEFDSTTEESVGDNGEQIEKTSAIAKLKDGIKQKIEKLKTENMDGSSDTTVDLETTDLGKNQIVDERVEVHENADGSTSTSAEVKVTNTENGTYESAQTSDDLIETGTGQLVETTVIVTGDVSTKSWLDEKGNEVASVKSNSFNSSIVYEEKIEGQTLQVNLNMDGSVISSNADEIESDTGVDINLEKISELVTEPDLFISQ